MNNRALEIINHFGINNQQRKLQEEVFELQEAITIHELKQSAEYEIPLTELIDTKERITDELADCLVLLEQIKEYYKISDEKLEERKNMKYDRTLERISNGYRSYDFIIGDGRNTYGWFHWEGES